MREHRIRHSWAEARQTAFDAAEPVPETALPLGPDLCGRRLAEPVVALQDIPHFDSAAMDGWAVNGSAPWIFVSPGERLYPGQASDILTGGLVPPGAKAVLRSESGRVSADAEGLPVLQLSSEAKPGEPRTGQHIRPSGKEAVAGEQLLAAGTILNPVRLALAALSGADSLSVAGRARVRLLFTGDEVVDSGIPGPGRVRDVFAPQLSAAVLALGAEVVGEARLPDRLPETVAALSATDADVFISTGGTGRSAADQVRRAIDELGADLVIDGVAMRPGGPVFLARLPGGRFLVGLPGNPLAAFMALATVAQPLLAGLAGLPRPAAIEVLSGAAHEPDPGRSRLLPYRDFYGLASPVAKTESAMLHGLAQAEGVLVVPPHGVKLGEAVPAFSFPWN
ncbi:MAG: molybdopterin molybdotransferase MoeA [Renibacterium sp.]|nr:molybdopterin molybdotransferase MoeA [Renibacterium sp.]